MYNVDFLPQIEAFYRDLFGPRFVKGRAMKASALAVLLEGYRYTFAEEETLQAGLATVLTRKEVPFQREVRLTPTERIDFVVELDEGRVGIECKIGGGLSELTRQLDRYARAGADLSSLLVVTTRRRLCRVPKQLNKVPIHVALIGGI